jgi:hypothetical protein
MSINSENSSVGLQRDTASTLTAAWSLGRQEILGPLLCGVSAGGGGVPLRHTRGTLAFNFQPVLQSSPCGPISQLAILM